MVAKVTRRQLGRIQHPWHLHKLAGPGTLTSLALYNSSSRAAAAGAAGAAATTATIALAPILATVAVMTFGATSTVIPALY